MKTIQEQIEVMTHFMNGGEVEFYSDFNKRWEKASTPKWDWRACNYRIKGQKKTITIEKWLLRDLSSREYFEYSSSDIDLAIRGFSAETEKVKKLETYEVEI